MVPINEKSLSDLTKLAATLNTETDGLTKLIEQLERKLAAAKIGVTVWVGAVLDEEDESIEEEDGVTYQFRRGWDVGYCKIGEGWRVAVKRSEGSLNSNDAPDADLAGHLSDSMFRWRDLTPPSPLVGASRIVRVEAAEHLDQLVEMLHKKVEQYIASIQKAKKLVE